MLARLLVPDRCGQAGQILNHAHSVIPHDRLLNIDEWFANAAAKPVIIPETINCDRGRVYLSETFLRACTSLGISVQPARPYTGSDKSIVERTFLSINTLFCQHVAGYAGRDTTRRGPDVADEAIWTVAQLQELFDEWVIACWQTRPLEGLSHTWGEGRDLSPNEMFTACVGISGYIPLPLTARRLHRDPDPPPSGPSTTTASPSTPGPTTARPSTPTGGRTPGCQAGTGQSGRSTTTRTTSRSSGSETTSRMSGSPCHGSTSPWPVQPFGLSLWEHARRMTTERSGPRPAEADIARNVADLLKRAHGQNLSVEEARAVAVEANRPAHPKSDS